ncbi:hypothetical protein K458DRAFT_320863 [Lentithecium fluviatile CBS 122367]|uniref:Uncharacterized protein n=1 Tax=Lentithecium fluviatile CBS 122367 TaxID=1168545 RepID=A0A6G1IFP0_9PLEO|nr:hypothetical protein K458DRAFT_320863 [Lentithecium fluviatile CBS 122367]
MTEAAPPPAEDIAHDDLCPVCHLLLYAPVRTQCSHILCASCMAQWASTSSTSNISHSSLDLDLTPFDPNYDPAYDLEANCPMCRTPTTASPDNALAAQLESRYPVTYAERKVEEEVERGARVGAGGAEGVMVLIGNRHRLERGTEDANEHDWTFFVRLSRPELVDKVEVYLHPTFRPPSVTLRRAPFEVRRLGWGTFNIEATIWLKEGWSWVKEGSRVGERFLRLDWELDFEGRGRQGRVRGRVRKDEVVEGVEEEGEGRRLRPRQTPRV